MPIAEEELDKTTFVTHRGTFRWICMRFVLPNASTTFQRSLDLILSGVRLKTCLVYPSDVLIFWQKRKHHIKQVYEVLKLFENAGLSLKIRKCQFFRKSFNYRGHVLLPGCIAIAKESTSEIADDKFPQ